MERRISSRSIVKRSMLFNMGGGIAVGSGTASATTSRIALVLRAISRASALAYLERSAISHNATTPPTALFSGGNPSADSFRARMDVQSTSESALSARGALGEFLRVMVAGGFLLARKGKGNHMGALPD